MAPAKYLVDTNAIIDYLGGKLPDSGKIFIDGIIKISLIKLPDAIIAATAISQQSTLITRNISDFRTIKKLEILNPHAII